MTAHKCTIKELGYVSPNDGLLRIIVVMIIRIYLKDGLKGLQAHSPGHRPGWFVCATIALKGQNLQQEKCFCPFRPTGEATGTAACKTRARQGSSRHGGMPPKKGRQLCAALALSVKTRAKEQEYCFKTRKNVSSFEGFKRLAARWGAATIALAFVPICYKCTFKL